MRGVQCLGGLQCGCLLVSGFKTVVHRIPWLHARLIVKTVLYTFSNTEFSSSNMPELQYQSPQMKMSQ
jgi:hypothetical protein